jgi:hypothetical protein
MQQNATLPALEPRQALALEQLLAGASVTKAAEVAGVDRSSLHRWRREDPVFQAAYNAARRDLRGEVASRLQILAGAALEAVERAIRDGDARIALGVLKGLGLLTGNPPPIGPADPAEVASLRQVAVRHRERESAELRRHYGLPPVRRV